MITLSLLVCVIGLILWLLFAKTKLSDPWVAEVGRIMFAFGLLVWLLSTQGKPVF